MGQGKRVGTFVVRYWWLADGERRLGIEHVQSGERHHCASLPEAEAWLAARVRAAACDTGDSPGGVGGVGATGEPQW